MVFRCFLALCLFFLCGYRLNEEIKMKPGQVIILNGPSASGKSSLQREIQVNFDEPYIALGIDRLFDAVLPDYYGLGERHPKGKFKEEDIRWVTAGEIDGKPTVALHVGPVGRRVVTGMHQAIAAYAKAGNHVVVDYINYESDWIEELLDALDGVPTFIVGVKLPLETIEAREASRSTSPVGHARSHFESVHQGLNYDFEITDASLGAEELALAIKTKLNQS